MKITLGEVLKLAKQYEGLQSQLMSDIRTYSTVTYSSGEEKIQHPKTVKETIDELLIVQEKSRQLRMLVSQYNQNIVTDYKLMTLGEALLLLKQSLQTRSIFNSLANNQPKTRNMGYKSQVAEYTEVTYSLNDAKQWNNNLENEVKLLRLAIDKANINAEIEIPDDFMI